MPAGELDQQPGGLPAEEVGRAVDRLGQGEPPAGCGDPARVMDLGFDAHDVGQGVSSD
jgi:hypothetical protein